MDAQVHPMRMNQPHVCYACGKQTTFYKKVKRIKNFVKVYECDPICNEGIHRRFVEKDTARVRDRICEQLSKQSPFLN